jgi:GNAT superfamily N-acetyltransferase
VSWDAAQKSAFLTFQFAAQQRHYRLHYPQAAYQIVCSVGKPIGRFYVARSDDEIRVLDIALTPEHRRHGIGAVLMREVLDEAEASGRPVILHVDAGSPALRFYERLGFTRTTETPMHVGMVWCAPTT